MHLLVDLCQMIAALCVAPILLLRSWRTGKYRSDWDQRRGHMPDLPAPTPQRPRVWIHAVSVGEMNAVRGLIKKWREQQPQTEFVISCTTDTGKARARELFPDLLIIRYPLDFSRFVNRAFDRIKPSLIVLVELEVWFNFVTLAAGRGIPVAVVNGRLSEKSLRWFSRIRPVARRMFSALAWVGAQDDVYAERFRRLGVPAERVSVAGSLKWETAQITDIIPGAEELARAMGIQTVPAAQAGGVQSEPAVLASSVQIEPTTQAQALPASASTRSVSATQRDTRASGSSGALPDSHHAPTPDAQERPSTPSRPPIWVCGSTGPGEEEIILRAFRTIRDQHRQQLQLVIVPRKPERFDEVAALIERHGFRCVRRSASPDGSSRAPDPGAIQLVDTMGELRKVYSLADVVFVGRSLVPMGGSDMMEVAALGKPILVGPYTANFRDAMDQLRRADAVQELRRADGGTAGAADISDRVLKLLQNPCEAARMGRAAREVVRKNLGATQRTLDGLFPLVSARGGA